MRKLLAILVLCPLGATGAHAQTWTTSFKCGAEWDQTKGLTENVVCDADDHIAGFGGWATGSGKVDEITADANFPGGEAETMGFRHWRGGANKTNKMGRNSNGGGIRIEIPSKPREVWIRYYSRFEKGFCWQYINYTKELYVNVGLTGDNLVFTTAFSGDNNFGAGVVYPTGISHAGGPGWRSLMGGKCSDGSWHFFEVHVDVNTGTIETWADGKLTRKQTKLRLGDAGIGWFLVGSNQCCVAEQPDMYTDYDDFAISTTGYIGPIGGTTSSAPR
jgi:hypothetical protein